MIKARGGRWQRTAAQQRNQRAKDAQLERALADKLARQAGYALDEIGDVDALDEGSQDSDVLADDGAMTTAAKCPNCGRVHTPEVADLTAGRVRCDCGSILDEGDAIADDEAEGVQELDDSDAELDDGDDLSDLTIGVRPHDVRGAAIPHAPKPHIPHHPSAKSSMRPPRSSAPRSAMPRPAAPMPAPTHIVSSELPRVRCPGCEKSFALTERNALPVKCPRCSMSWTTRDVSFSTAAERRLIDDLRRLARARYGRERLVGDDGDPTY
jgi:ribosomal protein S27E